MIEMPLSVNQIADRVVAYNPAPSINEWTEIDKEEITPLKWKWVDLEMDSPFGKNTIELRRPNWWIKKDIIGTLTK